MMTRSQKRKLPIKTDELKKSRKKNKIVNTALFNRLVKYFDISTEEGLFGMRKVRMLLHQLRDEHNVKMTKDCIENKTRVELFEKFKSEGAHLLNEQQLTTLSRILKKVPFVDILESYPDIIPTWAWDPVSQSLLYNLHVYSTGRAYLKSSISGQIGEKKDPITRQKITNDGHQSWNLTEAIKDWVFKETGYRLGNLLAAKYQSVIIETRSHFEKKDDIKEVLVNYQELFEFSKQDVEFKSLLKFRDLINYYECLFACKENQSDISLALEQLNIIIGRAAPPLALPAFDSSSDDDTDDDDDVFMDENSSGGYNEDVKDEVVEEVVDSKEEVEEEVVDSKEEVVEEVVDSKQVAELKESKEEIVDEKEMVDEKERTDEEEKKIKATRNDEFEKLESDEKSRLLFHRSYLQFALSCSYAQALIDISDSIDLVDESCPKRLFLKAHLLFRLGKYPESIEILNSLLDNYFDDQGKLKFDDKDIIDYKYIDFSYSRILDICGFANLKSCNFEQAAKNFQKLVEQKEDDNLSEKVQWAYLQSLYGMKQYDQVLKFYTKFIFDKSSEMFRADKNINFTQHGIIAFSEYRQANYKKSLELFNSLLNDLDEYEQSVDDGEFIKERISFLYGQGMSLLKMQEYENANKSIDEAISLCKRCTLLFDGRGQVLEKLGNLTEALNNYLSIDTTDKNILKRGEKYNPLFDLDDFELRLNNLINK
jgi:tetratricopeptide (TPR) repeat protein